MSRKLSDNFAAKFTSSSFRIDDLLRVLKGGRSSKVLGGWSFTTAADFDSDTCSTKGDQGWENGSASVQSKSTAIICLSIPLPVPDPVAVLKHFSL